MKLKQIFHSAWNAVSKRHFQYSSSTFRGKGTLSWIYCSVSQISRLNPSPFPRGASLFSLPLLSICESNTTHSLFLEYIMPCSYLTPFYVLFPLTGILSPTSFTWRTPTHPSKWIPTSLPLCRLPWFSPLLQTSPWKEINHFLLYCSTSVVQDTTYHTLL